MDDVTSNQMADKEMKDVWIFQAKFGHLLNHEPCHLTKRKLLERLECMQEELDEFREAVVAQDLAAQADALIDLVYFAKGTANMLGLTYIWKDLWNEVQRANMDKVPGITKRGHRVDVTKPQGWKPPQLEKILEENDYHPENFMADKSCSILERLCFDDEREEG